MTIQIIVGLSVLLQFSAALLALRLIRVTRGRAAWVLIAAATCLMAAERILVLFHLLGRMPLPRDFSVELLMLGVSLLMVAGIYSIRPLFLTAVESEERIREQRDFADGVVDTVGALVVVLDRDGRLVRLNRTCETTTGYRADDVRGRFFWDPFVPAAEVDAARQSYTQRLSGKFPCQYESHWLTKTGDRRLIAWSTTALTDSQGEVEFVIATGLDITEHRKVDQALRQARDELEQRVADRTSALSETNRQLTEEIAERERIQQALRESERALAQSNDELDRVLNTIGDGVMVLDADRRLVRANAKVYEMLGYTPEELRGKTPAFWTHPDSLANMDAELVKRGRGEASAYEAQYVRKDGSFFYGLATGAALLDADGNVRGAVGCIKDITQRKHTEQLLSLHAAELARSNAELENFAYVASHDLQEPVRKVQAFGDRLQSKFGDLLPEQGQDYLRRMVSASRRMQTLINDLLEYSRVTTKAKPFVPVDLGRVTRQVVSDLEIRLERSEGRVEIGDLPTVEADPTQMRQLLQNLVGNALKFRRPEEPPVVHVRTEPANADDLRGTGVTFPEELVKIVVEDNGVGFEQKHADRIFGVFQRLHGRDLYEGTGMGLAISRKIAERHGGTLRAFSEPGKGARFEAVFPLVQAKGNPPDEENDESEESVPESTTGADAAS